VERLRRGDNIALVSDAGTPTVSDPGARLIGAAIDSGARIEPIPGPSATLAALVGSGLPSETYLFLGFPPIRAKDRKQWFESLRTAQRTVVFFEAPHRIRQTLGELRKVAGDCRVAVGRELTKAHEEFVRGPISVVLTVLSTLKGEFTVVADIGHITNNSALGQADLETENSFIVAEFGHLTNNGGMNRKTALASLTRKYGRTRNDIYEVIERAKKYGV
jgi:16S rRNA (cytidine1402-2'-O)-methyltransferase